MTTLPLTFDNLNSTECAELRTAVLGEMRKCSSSWSPNKIRRLQVLAARLATANGKAVIREGVAS